MTDARKRPGNQVSGLSPESSHWHYSIFGQRLCSNVPLSESARQSFEIRDMAFRYALSGEYGRLVPAEAELLTSGPTDFDCLLFLYDTGEEYVLSWEGKGNFWVSKNGRDIQFEPGPATDQMWVRNILFSVVLSFALHVQSLSNFHASAVALSEGAVGFMAESGTGKSTLAAAFASAGYPLVTDDVLVLQENSSGIEALPGLPSVSLSRLSIDRVFGVESSPTRLSLNGQKQRLTTEDCQIPCISSSVPFRGFYVLDSQGGPGSIKVERLSQVEALGSLLTHTHCLPLLPKKVLSGHLAFAARLISKVPVYRISYPTGLDHLSEIIANVVDHETALLGQAKR